MYILITILIILVCVCLSAIVLIQNPKGGGVNASFSGASQQLFGASRSSDVVEKATWTLAALMLVFCLATTFFIDKNAASTATQKAAPEKTDVEKRLNETGGFNQPIAPVQTPQQQQPQPTAPSK
jgi:preprotein translocase subunit SecG